MAEWSIAAVLKTVDLQGSGGSNPSLSATREENLLKPFIIYHERFLFNSQSEKNTHLVNRLTI